MANKSFGVKELSVIGAGQTPTIESVSDIIVNANKVAISTNVTVGNYVGIGTTNPTKRLHVFGDALITGVVTASSFVGNLTGTATTANNVSSSININTSGIITASGFTGNLTGTATTAVGLGTTSSINTSGIITASRINVGTSGTTNTSYPLEVSYSGTDSLICGIFVGGGVISRSANTLKLASGSQGGSVGGNSILLGNSDGIILDGGLSYTSGIELKGGGGNIKVTQGNVGIGTVNPTAKLDVLGDVNISGILTASKVASGIPQNSKTSAYILQKSDVGKYISITSGGVTVPSGIFSEGDVISVYNNSASNQTITQGTSVTMYFSGTSTTGNRTLSQRGLSTILCVGSNTFIIGGAGLS
jgi:hypothetical protein